MTGQEIAQRTPQQELVASIRSEDSLAQVAAALDGTGISPTKFVRVAVTAINENAQLVTADRASLFGALMRCAQDGLLPDGREAALVMFGKTATYLPMVGGLRKIAAEYGWSIVSTVVHEQDAFDPDFEKMHANYKPVRLGMDPGDAQGAYAIGEHKDGRRLLEVMTLQEIEAVRATSRAKNSGPWVDWWGEMARKTVVRRLFKSLPLDPKDRERVDRVLAAETDEAALYGDRSESPLSPAVQAGEDASQSSSPPPNVDPQTGEIVEPFDGEEPEEVEGEIEEPAVVFPAGAYQGKTLDEVYALGADGIAYLKLAYAKAKTQPLRDALDEFATTHPDVTA